MDLEHEMGLLLSLLLAGDRLVPTFGGLLSSGKLCTYTEEKQSVCVVAG